MSVLDEISRVTLEALRSPVDVSVDPRDSVVGSYTIKRNSERYGDDMEKRDIPAVFTVSGLTGGQAREIAEHLSNWHAGCDFAYYVVELDGEDLDV